MINSNNGGDVVVGSEQTSLDDGESVRGKENLSYKVSKRSGRVIKKNLPV